MEEEDNIDDWSVLEEGKMEGEQSVAVAAVALSTSEWSFHLDLVTTLTTIASTRGSFKKLADGRFVKTQY